MYITIYAEISKGRFDYKSKAKVSLEFEMEDKSADDIIPTLGPLLQGITKAAIEKYRNPSPEEE